MEIVNKIYFLNLFGKYSSRFVCHIFKYDVICCERIEYNSKVYIVHEIRLVWSYKQISTRESNHLVYLHGFNLFRCTGTK